MMVGCCFSFGFRLAGRPHYAKEMGMYDDCHVVLYTYWCVKCHCITKFKPELFFSLPEGGWHERTGTAISEKKEIENEQQWMHGWIRCLAKLMSFFFKYNLYGFWRFFFSFAFPFFFFRFSLSL